MKIFKNGAMIADSQDPDSNAVNTEVRVR
jgi:hypothetical protein